jgi:long-chain acyl-CoA synthetase
VPGPLISVAEPPPPTWSPEPILAAADRFGGTMVDLDRGLTVGPAAFARLRRGLAEALAAAGLRPGDRLVMAIGNGPCFLAVLTAILAEGGTPLLVHAETPPAELRRAALRVGARLAVSDGLEEQDLQGVGFAVQTIHDDTGIRLLGSELIAEANGRSQPPCSLPGVPLHPTSGSTGQPKVAVRPGFAAMEEARHYVETLAVDERDVILAIAPMSHAYGYGMCAMVPLYCGAKLVALRRFDPKLVVRAIEEHQVTIFPAVPAMLDMLLTTDVGRLPPHLRRILAAGAPLSERTAQQLQKRTGVSVCPLYGSTETGGISIGPAGTAMATGCVGLPMEGVEVEARPLPYASHLGPGMGRVHIRSSSMMAGYLDDERLDTSPLTDGWFATGDLGRVDDGGLVHLKGREAEVINVYGMKVVPSEVEEVIVSLPGVREVKVYAGRRQGSQFVKAAVVAEGLDRSHLDEHCRQQLVYYKRPEEIAMLAALPKSPSGKVLRDQLP